MENNKIKGGYGEKIAAKILEKKGYRIICCNFRGKKGEIDMIASYADQVVFVEVKLRTSVANGYPKEAVDWRKQKKIIGAAKEYIVKNRLYDNAFRFDVIEILCLYQGESRKLYYNHIENAFTE